ncbi:TraR/DksA family transcriptional regulator [Hahella ganghwensis]|uniref:TraR/DksA family transcriptional regulator n=1 Tax=Hahella ganghwensis TaxID=286420 RepID=UPI001B7FB4D6|nr:TraR/DksA C4-type zinc finger protein [Hahella ganghwensis]
MDTDQIEKDLNTRLVELEARLEKIKQDATREHSSDSAEKAQERENDEVLDQLGNETQVSIQRIKAALQRIAEGTYGICDHCGEDIQPGRLEIMPESTRCVNCAD